ncbi:L,D-transpeptidase [Streptomyces formicae]|uniref:Putative lipoprotein n=1 Tax=Streptomyces formicae TaxID=1616117 RepID=A0A291QGH7_9ACTN|nr:Ig-like domain-containing protein [Streptomyces formicae]ATL30616.1 putative lipoprotein [Streptomyces formicae]
MNGRPISGASSDTRGRVRRRGARCLTAAVSGATLLLVAACGGGGGSDKGGEGKGGSDKNAASAAVVTIAPKDGAKSVATDGALKIGAEKGKLSEVKVEDGKGNPVPGKITSGGASWTPAHHLAAATTYKVHAVAKDSEGRASAKDTAFTTLTPKNTFIGQFNPEDGSEVGVGMPFSVRFTRGITDPEAVEKAIDIKTEPSVPVEGHWFGNDRLDFRPEKYWAAGTKVTVKLNLDGVEGRPGVYGKQAKTLKFTIGRSQVSTVDAKTHQMKVVRDGKQIKKIPITAGAPGTTTYNGEMVISEKLQVTRMNGDTVGFGGEYDIKDVPHAMRLSTSGTFIHGNYWSGGAFGNTNASHGCIGLSDVRGGYSKKTPAGWFFSNSMIGDLVVVKNSADKKIQPDNGYNGWNMSWEKWKA